MYWRTFYVQKSGNSTDEYEDAFAASAKLGRFAIADGATESAFASEWARLLVERFVEEPFRHKTQFANWLPDVQKRWLKAVNGKKLPWYAESKFEQGAFATFLGLVLTKTRWRAVAVGDSCLFQIRDGKLVTGFPVTRSDDFNNAPKLIGSRSPPKELQSQADGKWQSKDHFYLMTDALAQWFIRNNEKGKRPWREVERISAGKDKKAFVEWIDSLRTKEGLRNDDVTLMIIGL
ncbi:MAG: hypothetical protein KatS3mg105_1733 [Gemmatales bacterium]|nr:MAG: hypothetical protein KatS3mg105_1733 [Gemmatales bacterium]